jgi:hypothetical protein
LASSDRPNNQAEPTLRTNNRQPPEPARQSCITPGTMAISPTSIVASPVSTISRIWPASTTKKSTVFVQCIDGCRGDPTGTPDPGGKKTAVHRASPGPSPISIGASVGDTKAFTATCPHRPVTPVGSMSTTRWIDERPLESVPATNERTEPQFPDLKDSRAQTLDLGRLLSTATNCGTQPASIPAVRGAATCSSGGDRSDHRRSPNARQVRRGCAFGVARRP